MDTTKQTEERMNKSISAMISNFNKIRSGRAHTGLLDMIVVNCYGSMMPLPQVATVSVSDARMLEVSVWDKQNTEAVTKAIQNSDLNVNPMPAGQTIRVPLPPLSEERRLDLVKVIGKEAEKAKMAIRSIRHDLISAIRSDVKSKSISEDEGKRAEKEVQKVTDEKIEEIDSLVSNKQKELMTV